MATTTQSPEYTKGQTLYLGFLWGMEVAPAKIGKVEHIILAEDGTWVYVFNTESGPREEREEDLLSKADVDNIG